MCGNGNLNDSTKSVLYSLKVAMYDFWRDELVGIDFTAESVRLFVQSVLGDVTDKGVRLDDPSINWEQIARALNAIFDMADKEV
jgi:hypothetical protein